MNLAENMTNQQPTKRQQDIYQQVQYHAPVVEGTLSLSPIRLHDSASENYLVAQTEIKTEDNKLWLISSLPQFSNHVFLGLCDQNPNLIRELVARLDAQSEVNDKIRAGFFGGINLQALNKKGWFGFFMVPVSKWLSQFPTVIADIGPTEANAKESRQPPNQSLGHSSTENNHYSLVVLLTKDELELARRKGNRKLYQHLKTNRLTPYYVNTSLNIETDFNDPRYSSSNLAQNALRRGTRQRQANPNIKSEQHKANKLGTVNNQGSAKDISIETQESELPPISKKNSVKPRSKSSNNKSSNISAYQRLVGDLRTKVYKTTSEPNTPDSNQLSAESTDNLLFRFRAKFSKLWQNLALKATSIDQGQQRFLPKIPLRLQIIGETLSGGVFAIGGFIACIFLIEKGYISASLFSAIFAFAGIMMLTDAYRMSKRINNN